MPENLHKGFLNQMGIDIAVKELNNLGTNSFHNIPRINWWLLKYESMYSYSKAYRNKNSCISGLPSVHYPDYPENKFCDLYEGLDNITRLHKYEGWLIQALKEIHIQNNPILIQKWLTKYEKLGSDYLFEFWTEWYDEEENCIEPFILNWKHLKIKFQKEEWKNTIEFLEIFNEYYWDCELLSSP